jgi:hypothetical protein
VLQGKSSPALLHTLLCERQAIAKVLIDFDREFAKIFSAPPKESGSAEGEGVDPAEFPGTVHGSGARFTAGTATRYTPSLLTGEPTFQHLATGFTIGMRFHSAPVVRLVGRQADAAWGTRPLPTAPGGSMRSRDVRNPQDRASRIGALCAFSRWRQVPGQAVHAAGRRHRFGDRRSRHFPAGAIATRRRWNAAGPVSKEGDASA